MPDLADHLLEFINVRLPQLREFRVPPNVDPDTPLFESGLIDSMAILHVIAFVERHTSRRIPTRQIVMRNFRTVRAICQTFSPSPEVCHD